MVVTSDFFAGLEKQDARPHGHKAEDEHTDEPPGQVAFNHSDFLFVLSLWPSSQRQSGLRGSNIHSRPRRAMARS